MAITSPSPRSACRNDWTSTTSPRRSSPRRPTRSTLPSLFLATYLRRVHGVTPVLAVLCAVLCVVCSRRRLAHAPARCCAASCTSRCRCSSLAGIVSMLAGLTIERRLDVVPRVPRAARRDPAVPVDLGLARGHPGGADLDASSTSASSRRAAGRGAGSSRRRAARLRATRSGSSSSSAVAAEVADDAAVDQRARRVGKIVGTVLLAGFLATTAVELRRVLRRASLTYRFGLDPDNFGIPLVVVEPRTCSAPSSLILALVIFGLDLMPDRPPEPKHRWTNDHEI